MSHFAKIVWTNDPNIGTVRQVIVAEQNFVNTQEGEWIQTSYNTRGGVHTNGGTPLRKNYAGVGFIYDKTRDAFYAPKPAASWILNEDTCLWEPPVPYPTDGKMYHWNEPTRSWVETALPT